MFYALKREKWNVEKLEKRASRSFHTLSSLFFLLAFSLFPPQHRRKQTVIPANKVFYSFAPLFSIYRIQCTNHILSACAVCFIGFLTSCWINARNNLVLRGAHSVVTNHFKHLLLKANSCSNIFCQFVNINFDRFLYRLESD